MRLIHRYLAWTMYAMVLVAPLAYIEPVFAQAADAVVANDTKLAVGQLLAPWVEIVIGVAGTLITGLVGWAAAAIQKSTNFNVEASHRDALQTAITNAAGILIRKGVDLTKGMTIDTRHPAIREVILYINSAAPDALRYFNLAGKDQVLLEKTVNKAAVIQASPSTGRVPPTPGSSV